MLRTTLYTALGFLLSVALFTFVSIPVRAQTTGDLTGLKQRVETLEAQVDQLKALLAGIDDSATPMHLTVNCGEGQTISDALAVGATTLRPLFIAIQGVCHEAVLISRDNVTLSGVSREDGIQAPDSTEYAVSINGPHLVSLSNLTITGGGIAAFGGASFGADHITIRDGTDGIGADKGVMGILRNVAIQDMSRFGVNVGSGGHLTLIGSQVHGNAFGVYVSEGGTIRVEASTIEGNSQFGGGASSGGVLSIQNTVIQDNSRFGLYVGTNGTAAVANGSTLKNNGNGGPGEGGVHVNIGGLLDVQGSTIELNSGSGIAVGDGSIVSLGSDATVQNNIGSGVSLGHASAVTGNGQIIDNSGYGVQCADPSAWIGGFGSLQIGPNGTGATKDCNFGS